MQPNLTEFNQSLPKFYPIQCNFNLTLTQFILIEPNWANQIQPNLVQFSLITQNLTQIIPSQPKCTIFSPFSQIQPNLIQFEHNQLNWTKFTPIHPHSPQSTSIHPDSSRPPPSALGDSCGSEDLSVIDGFWIGDSSPLYSWQVFIFCQI